MQQILISCREGAIAAVLLIPVYWVLNRKRIHDRNRTLSYLLFSIYLATMYAAVGLPDITYYRFSPKFNFRPFLYMFSDLDTTILNVLLFMPLGFFLPLLWKPFRSCLKTMLLGFGITCLIETLQIFTYRATDVNDLITNTFGTLLGFLLGRIALKLFPVIKPEESSRDAKMVFAASFGVMFFLYPFLARVLLR